MIYLYIYKILGYKSVRVHTVTRCLVLSNTHLNGSRFAEVGFAHFVYLTYRKFISNIAVNKQFE